MDELQSYVKTRSAEQRLPFGWIFNTAVRLNLSEIKSHQWYQGRVHRRTWVSTVDICHTDLACCPLPATQETTNAEPAFLWKGQNGSSGHRLQLPQGCELTHVQTYPKPCFLARQHSPPQPKAPGAGTPPSPEVGQPRQGHIPADPQTTLTPDYPPMGSWSQRSSAISQPTPQQTLKLPSPQTRSKGRGEVIGL